SEPRYTINAQPSTWTTADNRKADGTADPATVTACIRARLAAIGVMATYSLPPAQPVAGSPYHITATLSAAAGVLARYNITNAGADFTINKKNATWTTNDASKTYGDSDPNPLTTGSGSGFLAADNITATYTRAAGESVAGGPYHITAMLGPAAAVANYKVTNEGANFTITKKDATWTTNPNSKTYGAADPVPLTTGSGSGFVFSDNVSASYSRDSGETVAGNPYYITATLSPS